MRLVDAHHHLWDLAAVEYPWLAARGVRRFFGDPTPIQRDYRAAELRADARPHEIVASVHVQVGCRPGAELDETRWLESCARRDGLPTAIVASVDLTRADAAAELARHAAASPRLRGVRQIVGREPADDALTGVDRILQSPAFAAGLAAIAEAGLSFDLQLTVPQMPRMLTLLERIPQLPVALCHCGSPWDGTPQGVAEWHAGLARLARLPNAVCKLSGLSMFDPHWTPESYAARAAAVLRTFGPQRVLFGSNFPVDGLHRRYHEIVDATLYALGPFGPDATAAVFRDNARRFYRLETPDGPDPP